MSSAEDEILIKISEIIEKIKAENEWTQEDVVAKLNEHGFEISTSELSRAKIGSKNILGITKLKRILKILEKLFPAKGAEKLNRFFDTHWWLYSFHDSPSTDNQVEGIGKAHLHIQKNGDVKIDNVKQKNSINYIGTVELHPNTENLIFNLKTEDTLEKNLFLNVIVGGGRIYPLAVGLYIKIDHKGALVGGTVLLEQIDEQLTIYEPKFYEVNSFEYIKELNPKIRSYLSNKYLNFMKVTTGVNTFEQLNTFLESQKTKKEYVGSANKIYDFEVFISSPLSSIDNNEYISLRKDILLIMDKLKSVCKFEKIHYAGARFESQEDFHTPKVTFQENMTALEKSKYMLLIYPKKITSSVLIEVGWALKAKKPCVLFVKDRKDLPNILQSAGEIHEMVNLTIEEYKDINNILKIIDNNGRKLFGEFKV